MGLGKPQRQAKFDVASFSRCKNIKGEPQIYGYPLAQGHARFSSGCDFMMGLDKLQLYAKFEVAGFICYRHVGDFFNDKFTFRATLRGS